jgi:hypothetical protein
MMSNANRVEREHGSSQRAVYSCLESQKVAHFRPLLLMPQIFTNLLTSDYNFLCAAVIPVSGVHGSEASSSAWVCTQVRKLTLERCESDGASRNVHKLLVLK